ncbi:hypothetical protein TGME49_278180 [Toxoplasma gondii ME49]|uniref:Transmembrane protein n=1 Tax=Toxoplasma gondii (strain ATCC 50611 / Me49) TaxID=508771 RepID=S8G1D6_TOXGM|nr:hypothetical protein TGME49_278180 [Toxoplasma gondii ME49]EPT25345.1 hypothetical protein TGME49_278180 [Toxoplasma gondii ME49]|eukprot:XP_002370521.2 hypothetical protein TGME49_278180 [Toxoplasma gondii ME49]
MFVSSDGKMGAHQFRKLLLLSLVGQAMILGCTAAGSDASGEVSPDTSKAEEVVIEVTPTKETTEQQDTVPSASSNKADSSDDKPRPDLQKVPTTIARPEQPCASSVTSRNRQDADDSEANSKGENNGALIKKEQQHSRSSDPSFLATNGKSPMYAPPPLPSSFEVMQSVLESLLQPFPFPFLYFIVPLDVEKKTSSARHRKSDHHANEETLSEDEKAAGQPQKQALEHDENEASLPVAQESAHASQQSHATTSPSSEGPNRGKDEKRSSRISSKRGSGSSSPSRYSSFPYYRSDIYDPVREYLMDSMASPYYNRNGFLPLPYYPYLPLAPTPYEVADAITSRYFGGENRRSSDRDLQDKRDYEYLPSIHTGDHNGLHQRPSRHEYEHRQYGSRYNHGMDRFFY